MDHYQRTAPSYMALSNPIASRFPESLPEPVDPFAMQLALSRDHARLVPMQRVDGGYEIHPDAEDWFELPAGRGLAGYGLGRALRMLLDVLRGLTALHDTFSTSGEPFAHGEVALPNFRVDAEGVCRLVPLTARHSADGELEPTSAALGHVAPERLLGESVDARADVFSAGVLLWEALAGRRLFEEGTADAIIDRLMGTKLQMPNLPPELAWAIPLKSVAARALAVDPYQRFSDCAELATAIAIVARERVASHAEIANFFGAPTRSIERRTRDSVRPTSEESSLSPALLMPSSGPRSQRGEGSVVTGSPRERPVPTQSATFSAVGAPASRRPSTLAALGPSSSRPPPPVTPIKSPFSALLMPQPAPLPVIPSELGTPALEQSLPTPPVDAAPRSTRRPPPLPAQAPLMAAAPASIPAPPVPPAIVASTLSAVTVALPELDEDVRAASAAFRPTRSRRLWTALAVCSISAALAVAALVRWPSAPPAVASAPLLAAQPQQAGVPVALSSDHSRRPLPADASSVHPASNNVSAPHAVDMHAAPHVPKSTKAASTNAKDYGI